MIRNSKIKPLTIIYIGNGKGKTTAAVGLAVRAAGAGKKVLFSQFVKADKVSGPGEWPMSSEISVLKKIKNITVKVLGRGFVGILGDRKNHAIHVTAAKRGLAWVKAQIKTGKYDVVVADELISAIESKLLAESEIRKFLKSVPKKVEAMVLTGHKKYNSLIKSADLVTEMKMISHPYYKGVKAIRGIDF